jgi:hypothetical protein
MKINEIIPSIPLTKPMKPKSPLELQVSRAKSQADAADARLKVERQRKRLQRTQKAMAQLHGMGY